MDPSAPDLRIRHVSNTYPNGVQALTDISLTIPRGMYGLLGPNGAGKSTLMRMLATLQEPDAGHIRWGDLDVVRHQPAVRASLGYLPQDFGLLGRVRAETLLDHFAILKGITPRAARREMVEDLLHQVNLWDQRRQKLGGFSGGMRQRFGVAVALLGNPRLLIVDEPTAGLDPAERVRFLNLLSALGEKSTVILSTHIVADVAELCTRMAIINQGQILLETQPLQAVRDLEGKIWRRLVNKSAVPALEQAYPVISTKLLSGLILLHIYCEHDPGQEFRAVEPDLEDVYFAALAGHYRPAPTPTAS
ncbi:ABC transporter ATP-binding protein [Hymenobacter sp. HD11105]